MARMPKLEAPQSPLDLMNDFVMNPFVRCGRVDKFVPMPDNWDSEARGSSDGWMFPYACSVVVFDGITADTMLKVHSDQYNTLSVGIFITFRTNGHDPAHWPGRGNDGYLDEHEINDMNALANELRDAKKLIAEFVEGLIERPRAILSIV